MREMKDSGIEWVGKIPKEWNIDKIKYLFYSSKGLSITKENLIDKGLPVISYGQIHSKENTGVDISKSLLRFVPYSYQNPYPNCEVKQNDFVFADTSEDLDGCGNCIYKRDNELLFAGYHSIILHSKKGKDNRFLAYLFLTDVWRKQIREKASGVKVFSITQKILLNATVVLPMENEQKAISDFLDQKCSEIDALYSNIEQQIATLEEYKKSVITEVVTKGLNPDVEMKDSGVDWIGMIPKHWELKRAKYIANSLSKGNGISKEDITTDGDIQCVRYGEIYSKYNGSFITCISATNLYKISSPKFISAGDILFAGTGELIEEIGKNIVYMGVSPCLAGGDIIVMNHSQNPIFLNYAMNSTYSQNQKSKGKAKLKVVHISAMDIGNIFVALPPIDEQKSIATYLDQKCSEIDALIEEKKGQLTVLEEYKKSLIYEYVTGKKEVM